MPLKIIVALVKSAHYTMLWFMILIGISLHANYILNTKIALEQNIQLTNIFIILIVLEIVFRFIKYYIELELWEIKNNKKLDYPEEELFMNGLINFDEIIVLDFKELKAKELFDNVYLIYNETPLSFSSKSTLCIDGIDYPVEAVSFVGENMYAIKITLEED